MTIRDIIRLLAEQETNMQSCKNCGRLADELEEGLCEKCADFYLRTRLKDDLVYWEKGE